MDRWTGLLRARLPSAAAAANAYFNVFASLRFSPSTKSLTVPSANAVFFYGDRAAGTGNRVVDDMSDPRTVAELLVSKVGVRANAWVVEASSFSGPFAVYRELVPSVDSVGNPRGYDPDGLPASSNIVKLLTDCLDQIGDSITGLPESLGTETYVPPSQLRSPPPTILLGFSKGGIVLNQILSELAHFTNISGEASEDSAKSSVHFACKETCVFPSSTATFLSSISQVHYVDVGLNCSGAYIIDQDVIKKIAQSPLVNSPISFVLHGTPRQWDDSSRPWIRKEKDIFLQMLRDEVCRSGGKLEVIEKSYFTGMPPSLQMHFEIIRVLDTRI